MRALIVTNMYPSPRHPALGSFVRDQVEALRRIEGIDVELFAFEPGSVSAYVRAARDLRSGATRGIGARRVVGADPPTKPFDIVHAHFGLTAWPALAAHGRRKVVTLHGTDLAHPRSRPITLGALRLFDLVAAVSEPLAERVPPWATRRRVAVLPAGVDTRRFHPIPRPDARAALGLDPDGPYLLFPSDPRRPEKRYDLARALAGDVPLLALGDVDPSQVPLWVNAANAVVIPSDREGFGLGVLEALACDVPVLATPAGIAPAVLESLEGAFCGPFDRETWGGALAPHLRAADPRIRGRERAEQLSCDRMAQKVVAAWRSLS